MIKRSYLEEFVKNNIAECVNLNDIVKKLGLKNGGGIFSKIREVIEKHSLNTDHFIDRIPQKSKYTIITKKCKICENTFEVKDGIKKIRVYCSKSCGNKDRIHSEESKLKISLKNRYKGIEYYIEAYKDFIEEFELLVNNKVGKKELKQKFPKIRQDDLDKLFKYFSDGSPTNKIILNNKSVTAKYLEVKNLSKVGEFFGVSKGVVRRYIPDSMVNPEKIKKSDTQVVVDWRKDKKRKLVEYKGGKCQCCGYDKSQSVLQFHHLDPKQKDFNVGGSSYSFERLKSEVDKCILVCSNCHIEIHEEIREKGFSDKLVRVAE